MSDGSWILLGLTTFVAVTAAVVVAVRIVSEAGLRTFLWPKVSRRHITPHAIRLGVAPWWLLFLALLLNGLFVLLFDHDLFGARASGAAPWLAACAIPILMAHLIDGRRSRLAAGLGFVTVAGLAAAAVWYIGSWPVVLAAALLVLWAFNGFRATLADHAYG